MQIACNQPQRLENAAVGADGNQNFFYPILETMPLTQSTKIVNLELQGAAGTAPQDIIFFKELYKSI